MAFFLQFMPTFATVHAAEDLRKVTVVSFGLFGDQGVFRSEATGAAQIVASRFGGSLVVVNHAKRAQCSRASALPARTNAETERRRAIASAVYRPCLSAFLLPFGAPGDIPPCIRQRPFGIAGAWHEARLRVRAPHRGLRCMGKLFRIV